ncbi:MAG: metallophosphoesterase [Phycisphaerales bacterium]|nr:metallophosphoesterase [Phycisphaerales bacterium]
MNTLRNRTFALSTILVAMLLAVPAAADQVLAVLEALPVGGERTGTWRADGRDYLVSPQTAVSAQGTPKVGNLVAIDFVAQGDVAVARAIQVYPFGPEALDDGPYVSWKDAKTAVVMSHCNGAVTRTEHTDISGPIEVPTGCSKIPTVRIDPNPPGVPAANWPMPERMLAISDLEGNLQTFLRFLRANGVIDEQGNWAWGDGHLVFNGDIVDRGEEVTELLWFIRQLEHQARAAGGEVHFVLGNHEAMVMAGDIRYIHPKYSFTTGRFGVPYEQLFGADTELGRWFRTRNSVLRIGNLLFVHAGYSPELDRLGLSPEAVNTTIRTALGPPAWPERTDLQTSLAWHQQGPLWYRGYHPRYAAEWGGLPSVAELDSILTRHGAEHIVVGHTVVEDICWLDADRKLIGIDVDWSDPTEGEGLLLEKGELFRVNMAGERLPMPAAPARTAPLQETAP